MALNEQQYPLSVIPRSKKLELVQSSSLPSQEQKTTISWQVGVNWKTVYIQIYIKS